MLQAFQESEVFKMAEKVSNKIIGIDLGTTNSVVSIVENGVETRRCQPSTTPKSPLKILILGSLFWRPNVDGIRSFLNHSFPLVLQSEPTCELNIVGWNPPRWLVEYAKKHRQIELHGNVPDVGPYLAQAGMLVVPLSVGGGSRLKILEAAAAGLPVVSTRIGAEGLEFIDGVHFTSADTIEDLGESVIWSIRNYSKCMTRAVAARQHVVDKYDWELLAAKLDRVWCNEPETGIDGTPRQDVTVQTVA